MSVTFGFYNSKEGDRRYDAIQMSSIFDGIIQDGILQHVGTAMVVKESEAMIINVGVGRAWFNHTWTLNDALLPLVVPQSEILLNRYDAVVLEVDSREAVRANDIKIIKGTPASNPTKPTMVKTNDRWQYPLAYIYVGAGVTSIRQANITNCVGTSECPFVTAPLDKVEIDDLIAQWQDQWKEFYEKQTTDMEETNKFWKEQWSTWFLAQTEEIQSAYLAWEAQWNLWYSEHTADMEAQVPIGKKNGRRGSTNTQAPILLKWLTGNRNQKQNFVIGLSSYRHCWTAIRQRVLRKNFWNYRSR